MVKTKKRRGGTDGQQNPLIVQDSKVASSVDDKGLLAAQTDLKNAEAELAAAQSKVKTAQANVETCKANVKSLKPKSMFAFLGFGGSTRRKSIRRKKRFV